MKKLLSLFLACILLLASYPHRSLPQTVWKKP